MSDSEALRRELEQFIAHHHATQVGDVTDAQVVGTDGEDTDDALLEALAGAVNPEPGYLGDEGGGSAPAKNTPPSLGLNWGPDGDEQLTNWFNRI